ncbi:MAG: hypothetical protein JWO58_2377 [Chitinophagaceae bacterium]|nr:hypothetical protein [Chitinophagaceae bacterium]
MKQIITTYNYFKMKQQRVLSLMFFNIVFTVVAYGQKTESIVLQTTKFDTYNVSLKAEQYKGKEALTATQTVDHDDATGYSFTRLKDIDFHNGIIEVTVAGQPKANATAAARGFVGIAFRIPSDTSKFEAFYLRPTNGRAEDQLRRNHSTQYISHPGYPWEKLRNEFPAKYESYVDIVAVEWIKIKIEVKDDKAKLYVNGAEQPSLIVNDLKQGKDLRGSIGFLGGYRNTGTVYRFENYEV